MSPRLAFALDAVVLAGRFTLAHFQTGAAVELKADASPVTVADRGAERLVRDQIARSFPGEHVLGEEEGGRADLSDRWVLDPIDGTKSFVSGVPLYGTLLSYEVDRQPILGVAFFPALNELVFAERGSGAFWNGRPCRVRTETDPQRAVLCVGGHRSMSRHGRDPGFARLAESALATRTWGDAYGHCLVATGRVDAMIDPVVSRWDLSAVKVIVEEAGGRFTTFDGNDPLARLEGDLEAVSATPAIYETVLAAFRT